MLKILIKQLRHDHYIFWSNSLIILLFLVLSIYVKIQDRGYIVVGLFDDPFLLHRPYIGTLSAVSELMWCVVVTICLWCWFLLNKIQPNQKINRFILYSAIGIGILLTDDVFRINLILAKQGISKAPVYFMYGIGAILYGLAFWKIIRSTPYILLMIAGILFVISGLVDFSHLSGKGTRAMLEDATRLLGIMNITLYFSQVCWQVMLQSWDRKRNRAI
ncbi:hypothetical protein BJP34_14095 [Moorena producens PAL-8-15-08-1]|uniref:Uncharacterized protein n=1 Tax=Moorena producens PAL-8-15-08-1 TaxID=1458985 RepID=A0A1D8TS27_9CYAN|nr:MULTISPECIES: hypothetical protein [Moorena]AOX00438.1 hypothetical protein BJP34_14095 [Moorena producens PAL-8-15-08-1]NEO76757.1 hypothetical protein [Moorena sp. SIO4G3]